MKSKLISTKHFTLASLIILVQMLGIPAFSQIGITNLQPGKTAVGLGYYHYNPSENSSQNTYARNIKVGFDWQLNKLLRTSLVPGISFLNAKDLNVDSIPPSPELELRLGITDHLNSKRTLDYFIRGSAQVRYTQIQNKVMIQHHINTSLTGGVGVLYRLETNTSWKINPFFGVFYSNIWRHISTTRKILGNSTYNLFTGEAGAEIEVSQQISLIGSVIFSFESSEIIYNASINFR